MPHRMTVRDAAQYIADMSEQLAILACEHKLRSLAATLRLASAQAQIRAERRPRQVRVA